MSTDLDISGSMRLFSVAKELIPGGSQTSSKRPQAFAFGYYPIYVERAEGAHVWDVDGNEYIDYVMALGPVTLGYCYPPVDEAVRAQLKKGVIYGLLSPLEVEAAQEVIDAVPCAEMVRFLKSGAEVTSAAVRIARGYTGRRKVASQGYHGWHDQWSIQKNDGGIPEALSEFTLPFSFNDADSLAKLFKENSGQIAAVILCPAGTVLPEPGFLEAVREMATKEGAVLIYDEIVTGFRIARGGAQEYFNVVPDLACFAKGMANGLPVAAVVGKREIMAKAEHLSISTTYGGEALSLAALVAACKEYKEKNVFETIWKTAEHICDGINEVAQNHGFEPVCYGLAPMAGMKLKHEGNANPDDVWFYFLKECAKRGVLMRKGGCLFVTYSHTEEDAEKTIAVCDEVLGNLREHLDKGDLSAQIERIDRTKFEDIRRTPS